MRSRSGLVVRCIGVRPALWIATAGPLGGLLWVAFSPVRTLHDLPTEDA